MAQTLVIGNPSSDHLLIEVQNYEQSPSDDSFDSNWLACRVSVSCDAWKGKFYFASFQTSDLTQLLESLVRLNQNLKGEAAFQTIEDQLRFSLKGNGLGKIEVSGTAVSRHVPHCALSFGFEIDQTYLGPAIQKLQSITSAFPFR